MQNKLMDYASLDDIVKLNLDIDFILENRCVLYAIDEQSFKFATLDYYHLELKNQLRYLTGLKVQYLDLDTKTLAKHFQEFQQDWRLEQIRKKGLTHEEENLEDLFKNEPIVNFIDTIFADAIERQASDIHFEPLENNFRIRFRLDGILQEVKNLPLDVSQNIISRLKIMAKLDIAEHRLPQDGSIKARIRQEDWDIRANSMPTIYGEKIVLRILDKRQGKIGIDDLGFSAEQKQAYLQALQKKQGMILITGPTGSGKTLSLYAGLNTLNTQELNISTAEDPVEIKLAGINQVNVNAKIGLAFSACLRAFLRQDPDVIMLGEIRDLETAEIAVKAAQTGHLLLSTLHTNSAADSLARLVNMGIKKYNLSDSLNLIIAQRLIRKLCNNCKRARNLTKMELKTLGIVEQDLIEHQVFTASSGCENCYKGYKGRTGIFELSLIDDKLRTLLLTDADLVQIKNQILANQISSLKQSAIDKFLQGVTSLEEIKKAINIETNAD